MALIVGCYWSKTVDGQLLPPHPLFQGLSKLQDVCIPVCFSYFHGTWVGFFLAFCCIEALLVLVERIRWEDLFPILHDSARWISVASSRADQILWKWDLKWDAPWQMVVGFPLILPWKYHNHLLVLQRDILIMRCLAFHFAGFTLVVSERDCGADSWKRRTTFSRHLLLWI